MCVQYIGEYHEYIGGYLEYIGGYHYVCVDIMSISGDTMSTLGRYYEYIRGCSVHWGIS